MQNKTMRTCLVTRQTLSKDQMIRFVISPFGALVFDFQKKLPGKGYWITPKRDLIEIAIKKNIFSKLSKQKVEIDSNFIVLLQDKLRQRCLSYFHLLKKASLIVCGLEKVKQKIQKDKWGTLIIANNSPKSDFHKIPNNDRLTIYEFFTGEELGKIFDREFIVYIAVGYGPLCDKFSHELKSYQGICFD
jgi:uncharacterized protein